MTPKGSRPVLRGLVGSDAHPATQLIDFLAVLFGYAISGERTLEEFYEQLLPLAQPFMALFSPCETALALGTLALSCELEPTRPQKPCARSFSPICSRAL